MNLASLRPNYFCLLERTQFWRSTRLYVIATGPEVRKSVEREPRTNGKCTGLERAQLKWFHALAWERPRSSTKFFSSLYLTFFPFSMLPRLVDQCSGHSYIRNSWRKDENVRFISSSLYGTYDDAISDMSNKRSEDWPVDIVRWMSMISKILVGGANRTRIFLCLIDGSQGEEVG